ncbi:hypothetical protein A0J61_00848 [Choanephora cucurbitarum]|uniref:Uncharacterized protein n=1 Tax=Choanephora cucurbitarum TaxID=101091 RepID=A0A1C7NRQ0_9FUNG|nr:hypothetical protein A0J61_00848 [Choanephora cucurbitarum]
MDLVVQSLEAEKKDTKAILIAKDLELAELRSKNGILQKTINRQEVANKTSQLQKKIDQLQNTLQSSQSSYKETLAEKNAAIATMHSELQECATKIDQLKLAQQIGQQRHESLEAQIATLSAHLSESQADATQKQMQLKQLQHDILSSNETNRALVEKLEASQQQIIDLESQRQQLTEDIKAQQDHVNQLESRLEIQENKMKDALRTVEQKNALVEEKTNLIEKLIEQFKTYRTWMHGDVIPRLRQERDKEKQKHVDELNRALSELHEAKKFVNKQALHLDELKSDVYWLTKQNKQLHTLVQHMHDEHKEHVQFNMRLFSGTLDQLTPMTTVLPKNKQNRPKATHRKRVVFKKKNRQETEDSDTSISFTSHSSLSDALQDSDSFNNDSGFDVLADEMK